MAPVRSCELLSESIFDIIEHNFLRITNTFHMLWIAIRKYLWHHWTQHVAVDSRVEKGCELLSESIFDIIEHNFDLDGL